MHGITFMQTLLTAHHPEPQDEAMSSANPLPAQEMGELVEQGWQATEIDHDFNAYVTTNIEARGALIFWRDLITYEASHELASQADLISLFKKVQEEAKECEPLKFKEAFYDYEKLFIAMRRFHEEKDRFVRAYKKFQQIIQSPMLKQQVKDFVSQNADIFSKHMESIQMVRANDMDADNQMMVEMNVKIETVNQSLTLFAERFGMISVKKDSLQNLLDKFKSKIRDMLQTIDSNKETIEQLEKEIATLKVFKAQTTKNKKLAKKNSVLTSNLEKKTQQVSELQSSEQNLKTQVEDLGKQQQLDQKTIANLQTRISKLEEQLANSKTLQTKVLQRQCDTDQENQKLGKNNHELQQQCFQLQQEILGLQQHCQYLQSLLPRYPAPSPAPHTYYQQPNQAYGYIGGSQRLQHRVPNESKGSEVHVTARYAAYEPGT